MYDPKLTAPTSHGFLTYLALLILELSPSVFQLIWVDHDEGVGTHAGMCWIILDWCHLFSSSVMLFLDSFNGKEEDMLPGILEYFRTSASVAPVIQAVIFIFITMLSSCQLSLVQAVDTDTCYS